MTITNITRFDPTSHILYRLKYRCEISLKPENPSFEIHFVVEINPLGDKNIYLEMDAIPDECSNSIIQNSIIAQLQQLAENGKLPR